MIKHDTYEQLRLDNQLCFPLYAAARKITSAYTPYLKELGITYTQYVALMVLWETDDIRVGDLCERMYHDNGTVTPLLKKMESNGLVKRYRSEKDERCVYVRLTDKGMALKEQAKDIPEKVGKCVSILTKEDAGMLYQLLYKILQNNSCEECK